LTALQTFKNFDVLGGSLNLWTFRKSQRQGVPAPTFTGHWVGITSTLEQALKNAIVEARDAITETIEYDLLAQNNEGSALTLTLVETHGDLIVTAAQDELPSKKADKLKDLQNTSFYSVKIVSSGQTLHAIARANDSWKSRKAGGLLPVVFSDEELELEESPAFTLSKYFDFFIVEDDVLISDKAAFESVLNYKQAHADEFLALQSEPEFTGVFSDISEIVNYVGSNKIQLRRAVAIRQKGHYKNAAFMNALRSDHTQAGLTINYDPAGRIIPSEATCADIFQALLDHRLMSLFSKKNYDVPSTSAV
jgi:hypothetical protein